MALERLLEGAATDLDKYLRLRELQRQYPKLFFQLLLQHTEDLLPYLYTPTVGAACQQYSHLPLHTHGLFLRATEAGTFLQKLRALPHQEIRVVVVTDGERILGLGDQGAGGMGISEGKILLYTAAAGVPPQHCLPVCIDVGTNNERLLADPNYVGIRQRRLTGAAYDAVVEEFVAALQQWRPHVLLQFEDFGNHNAFRLLHKYQLRLCCFNDDVQGTACIVLAGLLSALRVTGASLEQQRLLFYGAGEAGTGIGELVALALHHRHGIPLAEARRRCVFMDSQGLVCASRSGLQAHKRPFAHHLPHQADLISAVRAIRPTTLIGVSSRPGAFMAEVLAVMAELNERPIIFPLSNPTSQAECTFEEAHSATQGRVVFASGSPFAPLQHEGRTTYPAQANNAYVFPAVGFAAVLTECRSIPEELFLVAAEALAPMTTPDELACGRLFPRFSNILDVSTVLAASVAERICALGLGSEPEQVAQLRAVLRSHGQPAGLTAWEAYVRSQMFDPTQAKL